MRLGIDPLATACGATATPSTPSDPPSPDANQVGNYRNP